MSVVPFARPAPTSWVEALPRTGRWAELPAVVSWCKRLVAEQGLEFHTPGWAEAMNLARQALEALTPEERAAALREPTP